eukprot:GHVU01165809.1.p1 GENE.GHVU01165809.1~~GHVU01165809.1.p1  ORF type:complete len:214 (-),score=32.93 GHVU01165809.1:385-1026(-)
MYTHCHPGIYISTDHVSVEFQLNLDVKQWTRKTMTTRNMKRIDESDFDKDLEQAMTDIPNTDLEGLAAFYNKILTTTLNKHAPLVTRTVTIRDKVPWFSDNILGHKHNMRQKERIWQKHQDMNSWSEFKKARNLYHHALETAKSSFISDEVMKLKGNSRKLFSLVNNLLGKEITNPLPDGTDNELVEKFASFFIQKIMKIRDELSNEPKRRIR